MCKCCPSDLPFLAVKTYPRSFIIFVPSVQTVSGRTAHLQTGWVPKRSPLPNLLIKRPFPSSLLPFPLHLAPCSSPCSSLHRTPTPPSPHRSIHTHIPQTRARLGTDHKPSSETSPFFSHPPKTTTTAERTRFAPGAGSFGFLLQVRCWGGRVACPSHPGGGSPLASCSGGWRGGRREEFWSRARRGRL